MCSYKLLHRAFKWSKKVELFFPDDPDLRIRWIYFVNRKDWQPTKYSVICINHFEEKYVQVGAKRSKLLWNSLPVPTKQVDTVSASSLLRTPVVPHPLPTVRYYGRNDMPEFLLEDKIKDLDCLSEIGCPVGFSFRRQDNSVQYSTSMIRYYFVSPPTKPIKLRWNNCLSKFITKNYCW